MQFDIFESISISQTFKVKVIESILVFVVLYGIKLISLKVITARIDSSKGRYHSSRAVVILINTVLILLIARIWIEGVGSVATYFGFLTAGLAFALKDPIANIAGSGFIVYKKPFAIGDRIQIGSYKGDVVDINLFQFTLMEIGNWVDADQATGRTVHVPSGQIFLENQVNYSEVSSHIWNELSVLITFESAWEKAKAILLEILKSDDFKISDFTERKLREATLKFMLPMSKFEPEVFTTIVKEKGICLTMRYLCPVKQRRKSEVEIWERVLKSFLQNPDIQFSYETRRIFEHTPADYKETNPS